MNSRGDFTTTLTPIDQITSVTSTTTTLGVMILALLVGVVVSLVLAHILDRGVNPVRDAISDYGAREYKILYRLAAFWLGTAGLLMAVMLGDALFPKPTAVILFVLIFAAVRWAIILFPVDLPDEEDTGSGRSHLVLAGIAFASISFAQGNFTLAIRDDPFWDPSFTLVRAVGFAVISLAIATGMTRFAFERVFGLVERLFYAAMITWFATISVILLTA